MEVAGNGLDLSFRPSGYFWPMSLEKHLLSTIKGKERRALVELAIAAGELDLLPESILASSLSQSDRTSLGRIHPAFMGGEYLPSLRNGEVEIARIEIDSTTRDVTSVRARRCGKRIHYRIVDEYDGETLSAKNTRTSLRPLTLRHLFDFFEGAWSILETLECNFADSGYDESLMLDFVHPSSACYPDFVNLYTERIVEWGASKRKALGIGEYEVAEEED